jgi:hypothetical protein
VKECDYKSEGRRNVMMKRVERAVMMKLRVERM